MQNLLIHITRDSVSSEDDIDAPHRQSYVLNNAQSIKQIVDHVFQNYPLPRIQSTNYVWVLDAAVSLSMFSPSWPEHRLLLRQDEAAADLDKALSEITLRVKYIPNSTPEKMYEIFSTFNDGDISAGDGAPKDYFTIRIENEDNPALSEEQQQKVALLSSDDLKAIDTELLKFCIFSWRKIAFVVGSAMSKINHLYRLPDIFYAQRVRVLIAEGKLEGAGNLFRMGSSEVRFHIGSEGDD